MSAAGDKEWPKAPLYMNGEAYEDLYENYFDKDPCALPLACPRGVAGLWVADLCCGSAPVAKAALWLGALRAFGVDAHQDMMPKQAEPGLVLVHANVGAFLAHESLRGGRALGALFCRQGVNYWLNRLENAGALLAGALEPGGYFVFNTFLDKPSEEPLVRVTELGGEKIVESIWLAPDGAVHHAQFRSGREPHATKFDWMPQERFEEILSPWFDLSLSRKGSGAVFVCEKKTRES